MCDIINNLKTAGFCEVDFCKAKMKNYNLGSKYWRSSTYDRSNYRSRTDKLSVDVETGIQEASHTSYKYDIGYNSSKPSIENAMNIADNASKQRPKYLHLDEIYPDNRQQAVKKTPKSGPTGEIMKSSRERMQRGFNSLKTSPQPPPLSDQKAVESQTSRQSYTSDYLLGLRVVPFSLEKPKNLPSIPGIILCQPVLSLVDRSPPTPLSPPSLFIHSPKRSRHKLKPSLMHRTRWSEPTTRRVINLNLSSEINLHTSINAWKATSMAKSSLEVDGNVKDMCSKLRGLLNKLSPLNFESISNQIACLKVKDEEVMKMLINIIFEKAVIEPNFSELYAALSRRLSQWAVPSSHNSSRFVAFKDLMITRCQHEFERDKYGEHDNDVSIIASEVESGDKIEVDSDVSKKKRTLGNIRFIGELFMQDMLQEVVIHRCIVDLLKYRHDEDRLESFCKLLSVVGRKIDFIRSKPRIDQYFNRIHDILFRYDISSRLRFMLRDIMELRENNWIPRHPSSKPSFLRQGSLSTNRIGLDRHGNNVPQFKKSISSDDGKLFNTLPRNFSYPHKQQQHYHHNHHHQYHHHQQQQRQQHQHQQFVKTAKFADVQQIPSVSSKSRDCNNDLPTPLEVDNNNISKPPTTTNVKTTPQSKQNNLHESLSPVQIERKCVTFFDEYINVNDLEEAATFFGEMRQCVSKCCEVLIALSLEKNFTERSKLGDLFIFALIDKHVSCDLLVKSVINILDNSEDFEIDIPKFWEYLAEIFFKVFLVDPEKITTTMFSEHSESQSDHFEKLMKILSDVLVVVNNKESPIEAASIYQSMQKINCKCHLVDWHNHSIELLAGECEVGGYKEHLQKVILLEDWFPELRIREIEEGVPKDERLKFLRELVGIIAENVTSAEPPSVDIQKLKKSCDYLKKLSSSNDNGLEILNAVQEFVCNINHPFGVLRSFFDVFYDEDVVSYVTFDEWYTTQGDEPGLVAKESVRKFFEWLHQSDDDGYDDD